jgi:hypothetical protein
VGLRVQSRNKKFFTLFSKAGSNVVESAAILMEVVAAPPRAGRSSLKACSTQNWLVTTPPYTFAQPRSFPSRAGVSGITRSSDNHQPKAFVIHQPNLHKI